MFRVLTRALRRAYHRQVPAPTPAAPVGPSRRQLLVGGASTLALAPLALATGCGDDVATPGRPTHRDRRWRHGRPALRLPAPSRPAWSPQVYDGGSDRARRPDVRLRRGAARTVSQLVEYSAAS
jgi:hypothetical protein